jgi:hypothetical protein
MEVKDHSERAYVREDQRQYLAERLVFPTDL